MAIESGWNSTNTPTLHHPGPGRVYFGVTLLGTTRGPPSFDPGIETRNLPFDGKTSDISGLTRVTRYNAVITATLLEMNLANLEDLFQNSSTATAGQRNTITPVDTGVYLTSVANVRVIWKAAGNNGRRKEVRFPLADVRLTQISGGAGDDEVMWAFEARALADPAGNINDCPFKLIDEDIDPAVP